jgi:hypothetical protein
MTADVQDWLNNPSANFGWILIGDEITSPSAKRFVSRTGTVPTERPQLQIIYSTTPYAQAIPSGTGCVPGGSGLSNLAFRLCSNEPPVVGSGSFRIQATDGLMSSSMSLYLSVGLVPVPFNLPGPLSCPVYLDVPSANLLFQQGLSPIGPFVTPNGTLDLPIPLPFIPSLIGASLDVQVLSFNVIDARTSNALTLKFF